MPLTIIKGPPNSGRTEKLRELYIEALPKRPVLVVPSTDDIFDWERRLMRGRGAFLGARIMHFKDLVAEILESGPDDRQRTAGPLRRQNLTKNAMQESWPALARRLSRQPGLVDSILDLFDELRAALITPQTFSDRLLESGMTDAFLTSVGDTYATYVELLDAAGLTDLPQLASEAVRRPLDSWAGRPLFVAGFDDLSTQQLDLLEAFGKVTAVTIALTHEKGNPAMAVTERLLGSLEVRGATEGLTTQRTSAGDHDPLLFGIERGFLREGAEGSLKPGEALTVMRSSGLRGEAEAVSVEIARLIDSGVPPGEIAIAISAPSVNGGRFRDRLYEYGIEATLESETPAPATVIGQAVVHMLNAAAPSGGALDFIRFLRGPLPIDSDSVDWLERRVRRDGIQSASDAAALLNDYHRPPAGWQELTEDGVEPSAAVEIAIESMLEALFGKLDSIGNDSRVRTESRIATAILRACGELDDLLGRPARAGEILAALNGRSIKTWSVPGPESVVIASPYRLRAKRFEYLFMVSLQERGMGDPDSAGPFLSEESRSAVQLPRRQDAEDQERYLFYSCLSVPTRRLWLSSRVADEAGTAEFPSPLVDAVIALFDESASRIPRIERFASQVIFDPGDAPSEQELARSLAAAGAGTPAGLELPSGMDESVAAAIESASAAEARTRSIADISTPRALELLRAKTTFGATTLEAFTECPYTWFFQNAIRPSRFGPEPPYMSRGVLVHRVLEQLFKDNTGSPSNDDAKWLSQVGPLVEQFARKEQIGLGDDSAAHRLLRTQSRLDIESFIRRQARLETYPFEPWLLEADFGEDSGKPALHFNGWSLTGKIDRIDIARGAAGAENPVGEEVVVIDYKTGKVTALKKIQEGRKLQLQLYLLAVERLWKQAPIAAIYMPVSPGDGRPRGIIRRDRASSMREKSFGTRELDGMKPFGEDRLVPGDFDECLRQAELDASDAVKAIHDGRIEHGPQDCVLHFSHACMPPEDPGDRR